MVQISYNIRLVIQPFFQVHFSSLNSQRTFHILGTYLWQNVRMGLMDFIKGQLIDIIEWTDDSRDTLSYRFPDQDKAIKNGAQLIVRESQQVQFVYLGEFGDTFSPGKHTL